MVSVRKRRLRSVSRERIIDYRDNGTGKSGRSDIITVVRRDICLLS